MFQDNHILRKAKGSDVVLVCGGRSYGYYKRIEEVLNYIQPKMVVQGGASGADALARTWCSKAKIHSATVLPMWDYFGRRAGPMRNEAMLLLRPSCVLAFPGGPGTKSMIGLAVSADVPVWVDEGKSILAYELNHKE